jgi:uncharacterized membrane protein
MSTAGTDQILLATTAGAFAQAMGQATRSDRSAREDLSSRNRRLAARARQVRVVTLWRRPLRPAWALAVSLCIIALGLGVFSA